MSNSFKYYIAFVGGTGEDVWDGYKNVDAVDITDAITQVKGQIQDAGGWVVLAEQLDHPEPLAFATPKDMEAIDRLERMLDAFASMTPEGANHPAMLDWARLRMLLKRQSKGLDDARNYARRFLDAPVDDRHEEWVALKDFSEGKA